MSENVDAVFAAIDRDVARFGVERLSALHQGGDLGHRIVAHERRSRRRIVRQALFEKLGRGDESHTIRSFSKQAPMRSELDDAATGRQHASGLGRERLPKCARFELSKCRLAEAFQDRAGAGFSRAAFLRVQLDQFRVEVDEANLEQLGQSAPNARLAATARTDEADDVMTLQIHFESSSRSA